MHGDGNTHVDLKGFSLWHGHLAHASSVKLNKAIDNESSPTSEPPTRARRPCHNSGLCRRSGGGRRFVIADRLERFAGSLRIQQRTTQRAVLQRPADAGEELEVNI
jgi:hypothetical protein